MNVEEKVVGFSDCFCFKNYVFNPLDGIIPINHFCKQYLLEMYLLLT